MTITMQLSSKKIEIGIAAIKAQVTKGGANSDGKRGSRPREGSAPHF
jgi:transposase